MSPIRTFLIITQLLSYFAKIASQVYLYVDSTGCLIEGSICDGSPNKPFRDLREALDQIEQNGTLNQKEIILTFRDKRILVPESPVHKKYFELNKEVNLKFVPADETSETILKFEKYPAFSFLMNGGSLSFERFVFEGGSLTEYFGYEINQIFSSMLSQGFIYVRPQSITKINIVSCTISGILTGMKIENKIFYFLAMIFVDTYNNKDLTAQTHISVEKGILMNTHFPQGFIYSNAYIDQLNPKEKQINIEIKDIEVINYYNKNFFHWKAGYYMEPSTNDYFDFMIILNNTKIFIYNTSILNSSRILLANQNNYLFVDTFSIIIDFDAKATFKTPPEMIYLINSNMMEAFNITILNTTIYSYDDMIEPNNRDLPLLSDTLIPASLLRLEKNQALFGFALNNLAKFQNVTVKNSSFLRRDNFVFSLFGMEYSNKLTLSDLLMNSITVDTESRIGISCVFELTFLNELHIINGMIVDLSVYGYSILVFGNMMLGNFKNATNLVFQRNYFKTKSNSAQVKTFLIGININPAYVFVKNSALIMVGGIYLTFALNSIVGETIFIEDCLCLYGCLASTLYKNTVFLNAVRMKQIMSDLMSCVLAMAIENTLNGKNMVLEDGRGNSGILYCRDSNEITIVDSKLIANWGMGGFDLDFLIFKNDMVVCGHIGLSIKNLLVMRNSVISNGYADLAGGAMNFRLNNLIEIDLCVFLENESSSATSTGGAIYSVTANNLTIKNSKFVSNYGTIGGALNADSKNIFLIYNCTFEKNQGEVAAGFYLNNNNLLNISNCIFKGNQGFVRGGLFVIAGTSHLININNVSFIGNQAPFKGNLIEIFQNNTLILKGAFIDYDKIGNGNFIFLNQSNELFANELLVRNIMRLEVFLYTKTLNKIVLEDSKVENNEWIDSFIFSSEKNEIKIANCYLTNITITETASGFFCADYYSSLSINNITFLTFSVKSQLVLKANNLNKISIENIMIKDIRLTDEGSCFAFLNSNQIELSKIYITDFLGFSNDVFVFIIYHDNTLTVINMVINGYISLEQFWNFSCVTRVIGDRNWLNMINSTIKSENPSLLKVESLTFFYLEGLGNVIAITNTDITLLMYQSFLFSLTTSNILIKSCNFKNSKIYGDLITLKEGSFFLCKDSVFHGNDIRLNKSIIVLGQLVKANFIKISSDTNTIFLKSKKALYNLTKSIFAYKINRNKNISAALFINEENTIAFYRFVEVILRENREESLILVISSFLSIKTSSFCFNKAFSGGVIKLSNQSTLEMDSNKFYGNEAPLGGVMKFENASSVSILRNYFFSNKAVKVTNNTDIVGKGGCIYASIDAEQSFQKFEMKENQFIIGGAEIGGIIYFKEKKSADYFSQMNFTKNNHIKNVKARYYGNIVASLPVDISLTPGYDLNSEYHDKLKINNKISMSSIQTECPFQIILLDFFNQTALGDVQFTALTIKTNTEYSLAFSIHNTFLCFSVLHPASSTSLAKITEGPLTVVLNTSLMSNETLPVTNKSLEVILEVRKCTVGEYFDLKGLECLPCEPNFFSFETEFIEAILCKSCISEPFFCYGGFNHTPKAGYWRIDYNSKNFIKCPNQRACLGDPELDNDAFQLTILNQEYLISVPQGVCGFEYEGILCSRCIKGYAKTGGINCSPCQEGMSIFLMVIKILVRVFLYYYTIYKAVMMCKKVKSNRIPSDLVYSNFLIKIMIMHFQFLKSYVGFPFSFPSLVKEVFNIFSFSITSGADKVLNLECFFNFETLPATYFYCVINLVAPSLVVSSLMLVITEDFETNNDGAEKSPRKNSIFNSNTYMFSPTLGLNSQKHQKSQISERKENLRYLPYYLLIALMLSYDEILSLFLHNFSFINVSDVGSPEFRVVGDFDIKFYSYQHQTWIYAFALPATALIGIIMPAFIIFKILRARRKDKLKSKKLLLRFGYFYFAYDDRFFFYEMIYIMRKVFIFAMDTFFIKVFSLSQAYNPLTFAILICFFYTGLSFLAMMNKPYKQSLYPALNYMENISLGAQALTSWIGCLLLSINYLVNDGVKEGLYLLGFLMVALINVLMFSIWIIFFWKLSIAQRFRTALKKLNSFHKKKSIQYKKKITNKPVIDKKLDSFSQEEIPDINNELESDIYIPPHMSSRWSSRSTQRENLPLKENSFQSFIQINDFEINPTLGLNWIEYLWVRFYENRDLKLNFVKVMSSQFEAKMLGKCSKMIITKGNRTHSLQIRFSIQTNGLTVEQEKNLLAKELKVSYSIFNHTAFLFLIDYLYDISTKTINFKLETQINKIDLLYWVNYLSIALISESAEFLKCQVDLLMFDFLELSKNPDPSLDAFNRLSQQGIQYTTDSRYLNLQLTSENIEFQIIKTKNLQFRYLNKDLFYYREIKNNYNKFWGAFCLPNLVKHTLY